MPEFPDIILYAIPFFALTVILEVVYTRMTRQHEYEPKDAVTSISMGLGNVIIGFVSKGIVLAAFYFVYNYLRLFTIPVAWWSFFILFFLEDLSYYWSHRSAHEMRFFWASHVVHHSSEKYNLSTALRQTWTGGFYTFIFWLWLPLLGFHPAMIVLQMAVSLLYQYWIHTELIDKMPKWFEYVMNTPSHHRVHHGSNPLYLDRNHAGILIIWDRLFGTFQPEIKEVKVNYGLVTSIDSYNLFKIAFVEWYDMFKDFFGKGLSLMDRIRYLYKPPGWKHDGTGMGSEEMRKEWLADQDNQDKANNLS